jgi:hypothetical protein
MTLIAIIIPELNSGQALTNPPAGGSKLKIFCFTFEF